MRGREFAFWFVLLLIVGAVWACFAVLVDIRTYMVDLRYAIDAVGTN